MWTFFNELLNLIEINIFYISISLIFLNSKYKSIVLESKKSLFVIYTVKIIILFYKNYYSSDFYVKLLLLSIYYYKFKS